MNSRNLDTEIAEKVFGKKILSDDEMIAEAKQVWKNQPDCRLFMGGFSAMPDYPVIGNIKVEQHFHRYSSDISDAMLVVEKMRERKIKMIIETCTLGYAVSIDSLHCVARNPSELPSAICRIVIASLKSKGGG